jgi:hypothetical protein
VRNRGGAQAGTLKRNDTKRVTHRWGARRPQTRSVREEVKTTLVQRGEVAVLTWMGGTISTTGKGAFLSLSQLLPSHLACVRSLPFPEGDYQGWSHSPSLNSPISVTSEWPRPGRRRSNTTAQKHCRGPKDDATMTSAPRGPTTSLMKYFPM